ncbi:hypothetical protein ACIGXF_25285 [Streptomyces sp. NPDC053086]|uniref:hypothetical protein n=1 Tax=unclassified Streptomyces TaxID=2593676 RepID=UPI0037CE54EE
MTATQHGPQVSGAGSGSSSGNGDDDGSKKIRKFEAVIIVLMGVIAAFVTGITARTMDRISYFEAIVTGVAAGFALPGFIIMIIEYIRKQT